MLPIVRSSRKPVAPKMITSFSPFDTHQRNAFVRSFVSRLGSLKMIDMYFYFSSAETESRSPTIVPGSSPYAPILAGSTVTTDDKLSLTEER